MNIEPGTTTHRIMLPPSARGVRWLVSRAGMPGVAGLLRVELRFACGAGVDFVVDGGVHRSGKTGQILTHSGMAPGLPRAPGADGEPQPVPQAWAEARVTAAAGFDADVTFEAY